MMPSPEPDEVEAPDAIAPADDVFDLRPQPDRTPAKRPEYEVDVPDLPDPHPGP